ncbi:hypothetical protein C8R47DRAFT_1079506 [Mycena vitilis]|nr:hypothetical protein C8R47DRAFT_1079506 [Mycena vitilis]
MAAVAKEGTTNVCKAKVENFPTFPAISIRANKKPCTWSTPMYEYEVGDDVTEKQFAEHILELNILKYVIESDHGPCDQSANELANGHASTDPEVVAGITATDAPHLLKATNSYLKLTKDGTDTTLLPNIPTPNTMEVARKLDAAIASIPTFDGATLNAKVVDEWK